MEKEPDMWTPQIARNELGDEFSDVSCLAESDSLDWVPWCRASCNGCLAKCDKRRLERQILEDHRWDDNLEIEIQQGSLPKRNPIKDCFPMDVVFFTDSIWVWSFLVILGDIPLAARWHWKFFPSNWVKLQISTSERRSSDLDESCHTTGEKLVSVISCYILNWKKSESSWVEIRWKTTKAALNFKRYLDFGYLICYLLLLKDGENGPHTWSVGSFAWLINWW